MKKFYLYLYTALSCLFVFSSSSFAQAPSITVGAGFSSNAGGRGIAYGNGTYVLALDVPLVYKSPDGAAWSKVTDPSVPGFSIKGLAFGAGVFVVAGDGGGVASSADGTTWTVRSTGTSNDLADVKFLQGAFYAVGKNATILRSADGITWSKITPGAGSATDQLMGIDYGNGLLVIGGRASGTSIVYHSSSGDPGSWGVTNLGSSVTLNALQYLKDRFYIFTTELNIWTSTDASAWTNATGSMSVTLPNSSTATFANGSHNQIFSGFYDGTNLYFLGYSNYYQAYGAVYSSSDGANFTLLPLTAIQSFGGRYLNSTRFIYGYGGLVSSTDGVNFKLDGGGDYYGLASNGTNYVGVGYMGSGFGLVVSSTDFSTWLDRTPAGQAPLYGVVYDGSRYLAVGTHSVVTSANGNSWSQLASPSLNFTAVGYGAGQYVAGSTNAGGLYYSANGTTWTAGNTDDNYFFKIKYINSQWFAVGYSNVTGWGVIMHSADGISWTDITPNLSYFSYYYNDVVYDGTKYYFMGMETDASYNYVGFYSVSTSDWNDPNSYTTKGTVTSGAGSAVLGGTFGEGAFAYGDGRFVGSVIDVNTGQAYVLYSSDGASWSAVSTDATTSMYGIVATNSDYRMLGTSNGRITASFGSPLPVVLLDFTAVADGGNSVLRWRTASEENSCCFVIQHSLNGVDWDSIGAVAAAGHSDLVRDYGYTHVKAPAGDNYYRLVLKDLDGKSKLSPVKTVTIGGTGRMRIYPNPVREAAVIELPQSGEGRMVVFNSAGQRVLQQVISGYTMTLATAELPAGLYHVVVFQNGKRYEQDIIRK
ncbi:MAG: T9SS type A sorting domain-containing protein [Bacteroidetes bacterium]|nr:T9SS type A sorting domain-containing protein [Bacteroidota bacterium]